MKNDNALCFLIKAPIEHIVKTRMQPDLSSKECLMLYRAMVEDMVEELAGETNFSLIIFYTPQEETEKIINWIGCKHTLIPQKGSDLGKKMESAVEWVFKECYKKAILIGSDIPMLQKKQIEIAFNLLDSVDMVLGPSVDGGYYLMGMKKLYSSLFHEIPWSTAKVYEKTCEIICTLGISFMTLPTMNDLDTYQDILKLWKRMNREEEKYQRLKTYCVLKELIQSRYANQ